MNSMGELSHSERLTMQMRDAIVENVKLNAVYGGNPWKNVFDVERPVEECERMDKNDLLLAYVSRRCGKDWKPTYTRRSYKHAIVVVEQSVGIRDAEYFIHEIYTDIMLDNIRLRSITHSYPDKWCMCPHIPRDTWEDATPMERASWAVEAARYAEKRKQKYGDDDMVLAENGLVIVKEYPQEETVGT